MPSYKTVSAIHQKHSEMLQKYENVNGTAVGYKIKGGRKTTELSIVCFVSKKIKAASLSMSRTIPGTLDGVKTDVVEIGEIRALPDEDEEKYSEQSNVGRYRPAPGGVSCGHKDITAGTLGMWVKFNDEWHILSNNHVLANSNAGKQGDAIYQPGRYDGGGSDDLIAKLNVFKPINFSGGLNKIDAALAVVAGGEGGGDNPDEPSDCVIANWIVNVLNWIAGLFNRKTRLSTFVFDKEDLVTFGDEYYVRDEILGIGKPTNFVVDPNIGMKLKKQGRTTGLTFGEILYVDATVQVGYGEHGTAVFVDQIIAGNMSAGGDSGSIVVLDDGVEDSIAVVGLLFAGSDTHTIMNKITNVMDEFSFGIME